MHRLLLRYQTDNKAQKGFQVNTGMKGSPHVLQRRVRVCLYITSNWIPERRSALFGRYDANLNLLDEQSLFHCILPKYCHNNALRKLNTFLKSDTNFNFCKKVIFVYCKMIAHNISIKYIFLFNVVS